MSVRLVSVMIQESKVPCCDVPGCTRPAAGRDRKPDGTVRYRKANWVRREYGKELTGWVCGFHHKGRYNMGKMAYRKHVEGKCSCSNVDGHLGFPCVLSKDWYKELLDTDMFPAHALLGLLDCDHIDGNSSHNDAENIQIICKFCHYLKTYLHKDWLDHAIPYTAPNSLDSLFISLTD